MLVNPNGVQLSLKGTRGFSGASPGFLGETSDSQWSKEHDPHNAKATPAYDEWGWAEYWSCIDWQLWFDSLEAEYGLQEARYRWGTAWQKQEMFAGPIDCRSFNAEFRDWAKAKGVYSYLYWGPIAPIVKPIGTVVDVGDSILGVTKPLFWTVVIAVGGFYGYKAYSTVKRVKRLKRGSRRKGEES